MPKKKPKKGSVKAAKPIRRLVLQPFVSAGELFVTQKGEAGLVPLSLFQMDDGVVVFRVGETTYWFTADGVYDGPEARLIGNSEMRAKVAAMLSVAADNKGKAPTTSYFEEGTPGHAAETALWPSKEKPS